VRAAPNAKPLGSAIWRVLGLTRQPLPNPAWSDAAVRYLCGASALCRSRSKSAVGAPHGIACIQMTIEIVFRMPKEDVLTTYLQDHWRAAFQRSSSSNPQDRKGVGAWELEDTCRVALARSRVCTKSAFLLDRHDSQLCAECLHRNQARTSAEAFRPCAHRRTRKSKL
jgi:hypothetical protein